MDLDRIVLVYYHADTAPTANRGPSPGESSCPRFKRSWGPPVAAQSVHETRRLGVINPGRDASIASQPLVAWARVATRIPVDQGPRARGRIRR